VARGLRGQHVPNTFHHFSPTRRGDIIMRKNTSWVVAHIVNQIRNAKAAK
jgi:hypothetical protein